MAIPHLKLSEYESQILRGHIKACMRDAEADHTERLDRFRRYEKLWRRIRQRMKETETHVTPFRVPLVAWQVASKNAQLTGAILGEDAEIHASPRGGTDQKLSLAVADYMDFYLWDHMDCEKEIMEIVHRCVLNGRTHALTTYEKDDYYEGVKLTPIHPDHLIVPAEEVKCVQEFSWVVHREPITPEQLLDGQEDGRFINIDENWQRICDHIRVSRFDSHRTGPEPVRWATDEAEGVARHDGMSNQAHLHVSNWYGRWRMPTGEDVAIGDWEKREKREKHIVVRYIEALDLIVGIQELDAIYPRMRYKLPICDFSLTVDGSYWTPGYGEMLEQIEDEVSAAHRSFRRAVDLNSAPIGFYKPRPGMKAETLEVEPGKVFPSDNPKEDIHIITFQSDLSSSVVLRDALLSYAERRTGQSDQALGRAIDRPNAPRTAFQTAALMQAGDTRGSLEISGIRKDLDRMLWQIWDLDCAFNDSKELTFFRVTEEQARKWGGDWQEGKAALPNEARNGRYDFRLQFATSTQEREAKAMKALQRAQLDMANPLILQDPVALWEVTRQYHEALGDKAFESIVPMPAELDRPKSPKVELARLMQGEKVYVHAQDNHAWHKKEHVQQMEMLQRVPTERRNVAVLTELALHLAEHDRQERAQVLTVGLVDQMASAMPQLMPQGGEPVDGSSGMADGL